MIPKPIDPYGVAKYGVEMDIKCGYEQHGLRYTIVRPHNVIGIYQNIWDKYRNVVGIFIRKALDGEPILVYGDGHQTRAFSDIKFYLQPFEQFIRNFDGETFNLGADKVWSINEVADIVVEIAAEQDIQCEIKHVEPRHEVQCAHCNQTKAKHLLEFTDNTDLKTLTKEMFLWAMKQPKRNQKIANMEITKGLYEYWK
jgi:UDP-glucose 4-epimerase